MENGKAWQHKTSASQNKFITSQLEGPQQLVIPSPHYFPSLLMRGGGARPFAVCLHSVANVLAKADSIRPCMQQTHLWPFLISSFSLGHDTSACSQWPRTELRVAMLRVRHHLVARLRQTAGTFVFCSPCVTGPQWPPVVNIGLLPQRYLKAKTKGQCLLFRTVSIDQT